MYNIDGKTFGTLEAAENYIQGLKDGIKDIEHRLTEVRGQVAKAEKDLKDSVMKPGKMFKGSDGNVYLADRIWGVIVLWRMDLSDGNPVHGPASYWQREKNVTFEPILPSLTIGG